MEKFLQVLVDYWQFISSGILILLSILLFIFRRKPKTWNEFLDCLSSVLYWVPHVIQQVESFEDVDGLPTKKEYALQVLLDLVENRLKRELTTKELNCFYQLMSEQIESVLTCPTKKGGIGREE